MSTAATTADAIIERAAMSVQVYDDPVVRLSVLVGHLQGEIRRLCNQLDGYANTADDGDVLVPFTLPACTTEAAAVIDAEDGELLAILVNGADIMPCVDADTIDAAQEAAEAAAEAQNAADQCDLWEAA